jgi:hypothetical protein
VKFFLGPDPVANGTSSRGSNQIKNREKTEPDDPASAKKWRML